MIDTVKTYPVFCIDVCLKERDENSDSFGAVRATRPHQRSAAVYVVTEINRHVPIYDGETNTVDVTITRCDMDRLQSRIKVRSYRGDT